MTEADQERCAEIERRLTPLPLGGYGTQDRLDLRFLLDRLRTADAMLQDAFLSHGIDVASVERAVAEKCRYICLQAAGGLVGVPVYAANRIANAIAAAYNLLPLEDAR